MDAAKNSGTEENRTATTPVAPTMPPKPGSELKGNVAGERNADSQGMTTRRKEGGRVPQAAQSSKAASAPVKGEERAAAGPGPSVPNVPAPSVNAGRLQEMEHDMDLLSSRADAVDASLEGLRQNQAAQGLGLRGDIAGSQQRMRTYMTKAQSALRDQDADQAKKYLDLAETEVAKLEKFLGR
jgi:hypothetical protein